MVHPLFWRRIHGGRLGFLSLQPEKTGQEQSSNPSKDWSIPNHSSGAAIAEAAERPEEPQNFSSADRNLTRAQQKSEPKSSGLFGNGQPAFISVELLPSIRCISPVISPAFPYFLKPRISSWNPTFKSSGR